MGVAPQPPFGPTFVFFLVLLSYSLVFYSLCSDAHPNGSALITYHLHRRRRRFAPQTPAYLKNDPFGVYSIPLLERKVKKITPYYIVIVHIFL